MLTEGGAGRPTAGEGGAGRLTLGEGGGSRLTGGGGVAIGETAMTEGGRPTGAGTSGLPIIYKTQNLE